MILGILSTAAADLAESIARESRRLRPVPTPRTRRRFRRPVTRAVLVQSPRFEYSGSMLWRGHVVDVFVDAYDQRPVYLNESGEVYR